MVRVQALSLVTIINAVLYSLLCLFPAQLARADDMPLVLVVSIDGLRPDVLLRSKAPVISRLYRSGSFTFYAKTTELAVTLPSHASMLTGVPPSVHGVTWNDQAHGDTHRYPLVPTIFELARARGITSILVAGKPKFLDLIRNGAPAHFFVPEHLMTDGEVAQVAARMIVDQGPTLSFVHLPSVDSVGHQLGWGSKQQEQAVAEADQAVAVVLKAFYGTLSSRPHYMLLTSDHGGSMRHHGADIEGSAYVPLLLVGPKVRQDFDLTLSGSAIRIEDVFATICELLGVAMPPETLGKSVLPLAQPSVMTTPASAP